MTIAHAIVCLQKVVEGRRGDFRFSEEERFADFTRIAISAAGEQDLEGMFSL
jgi:hypothetical protein